MKRVSHTLALAIAARSYNADGMKSFLITLTLGLASLACLLIGNNAKAAQGNPTPENVGVYSQTASTVTVTSNLLLAANPNRDYLFFQNQGLSTVIIKFDTVQTASEGIIIPAAGSLQFYGPTFIDKVYAKSATGSVTLEVIEGIK